MSFENDRVNNSEGSYVSKVEEIYVPEEFSPNKEKIRNLRKTIKKIKKKIHHLEEQEVNFSDEENSAYIKEDRYKRRLIELYAELNEIISDEKLEKQILKKQLRRSDIPDELTNIESIDDVIISFVNSGLGNKLNHIKNPHLIANHIQVPNYSDIFLCIKKCNNEQNLDLSVRKMEEMARTALIAIGKYLKEQRIKESENYISFYLVDDSQDPALNDPNLNEILQRSKEEGDRRLDEIFQKYVNKQNGLLSDNENAKDCSGDNSNKYSDKQKKMVTRQVIKCKAKTEDFDAYDKSEKIMKMMPKIVDNTEQLEKTDDNELQVIEDEIIASQEQTITLSDDDSDIKCLTNLTITIDDTDTEEDGINLDDEFNVL